MKTCIQVCIGGVSHALRRRSSFRKRAQVPKIRRARAGETESQSANCQVRHRHQTDAKTMIIIVHIHIVKLTARMKVLDHPAVAQNEGSKGVAQLHGSQPGPKF